MNSFGNGDLRSAPFDRGEFGGWHDFGGRGFGDHGFGGRHGFGGDWGFGHDSFEGDGFSFFPDLLALLNPFRVVGSLGLDLLSTGLNLLDSAMQADTGYAHGGYGSYGGYGVYGGILVPSYVAPVAPAPLVMQAPVPAPAPAAVPCAPGYLNCPPQ